VLENFVPGITQKLQIDYETLKKYNPKLVYCSVSGYGDFGSKADFPAFDNIIQAETGFMHLTGNQEQPFKMGFAITDVLTALYASNAILAGIIYTQQTGEGIHLKTSLYECAISSLINQASNYLNGGVNPQRLGNHHPNIVPYGIYTANDGEVVICVGTVKQYEGLLKALGVNQKDHKLVDFTTNESRVKNRGRFDEFLNEELKRFTSS
jgi:crotonobetainyl-CoA:carnitine CoA-transferase CaiB-like acyl-CoA transferase